MTPSEFIATRLRTSTAQAAMLTSFATVTYAAAVLALISACAAIVWMPAATGALCVAATVCGWSEVTGLCGRSHIGTLTPIFAVHRWLWAKAVGLYTGAGLATAALTGSIVGMAASWSGLRIEHIAWPVLALAATLAARELGWIRFELPQVRRQTHKMWAFEFGILPAAAMWGSHIGLTFATVIAHGGIFVLTVMALALGPAWGALIFACYWIGRTLPLWAGPWLASSTTNGAVAADAASEPDFAHRLAAAAGLICAASAALRFTS